MGGYYNPVMDSFELRRRFLYAQRRQNLLDALALDRVHRQNEQQDFQNRMSLEGAGYEPASEADLAEANAPRYRTGAEGNLEQIGTGTSIRQRMLDYGGRQYVRPSVEERLQEKIRMSKALNDATGIPVPPEIASKLGYAPGTRVPPQVFSTFDDILRAMAPPKPATAARPFFTSTDQGTYLISPEGNVKEAKTPEGKAIRKAPGTTGGEGTLAAERLKLSRQNARRQQLVDLEGRENRVAADVARLRVNLQKAQADKDPQQPEIQAQLNLREAILRNIRLQKVRQGFTTPEDAGLAGRNPAPAQRASKADVQAYANSLGISYDEALKKAKAEGYEVQ